jgi:beta-lactamase class A
MQRILSHSYFDHLIPSQIPPWVAVANKYGAVNQSRSDVALVHSPSGDYVIAIYTKENADQRWTKDNEAEIAIRAVSRAVWKHYNPRINWTPPPGVEKF